MKKWKLKNKDSNEVLEVVKSVDEIVSHKLQHISIVLTALMAIVTSVLAYLFVVEIAKEQMVAVEIASLFALLILGILLWAYLPVISRSQKKSKREYLNRVFSPSDLKLGAGLNDMDFLNAYQTYFKKKLTIQEETAVILLKNKLNELRFRTSCLVYVFSLCLLGCAIVFVALLLLMLKEGVCNG